jgi:D-glycero-D-manno-heptose 1,7-bisphosphate phosphatase
VRSGADSGRHGAVFLDRDGTIVEDTGYLSNPAEFRLLPGSGPAIRNLNRRGWLVLVVTNQSGIARGLLTLEQYQAGERRLDELLAQEGARLDAHYFCPHLPEVTGACECRKPGTLLYRQAADRFDIDLKGSWWVGDRIRDLMPARAFGGRGVLVLTGAGQSERAKATRLGFGAAPTLTHAVEQIIR